MKVLIAAAAAAVLIALPAAAQTTTTAPPANPVPPNTCPALPAAPTLPDGATATRAQMTAGNTAYNAWLADFNSKFACYRSAAQAALAVANARTAEHNAGADLLNSTNHNWQAEVAEFDARGNSSSSSSSSRQRGGVLGHSDHN